MRQAAAAAMAIVLLLLAPAAVRPHERWPSTIDDDSASSATRGLRAHPIEAQQQQQQQQLSNATLQWWRWAVVRVANQAGWIPLNDSAGLRAAFVEEWDPDLFDWGGDFRWQAGEWARLRGLPVAHASQFEYETTFWGYSNSSDNVVNATWGPDAVSRDTNGQPVMSSGAWAHMTQADPLWHLATQQGIARVGLAGDAVTQDNSAGNLAGRIFKGGFGRWENTRFIESAAGKALGLNSSFSIGHYVDQLRLQGLKGDPLVRDPVISAFIRFTYALWLDSWADVCARTKALAAQAGRAVLPAVYGNLGHKYPTVEIMESTHHDVYWIESFVRAAVPAQQPEDYPGVCTTIGIKAAQAADRSKPLWRCTQDVKTRSEHRIYLAEAMANGANEWLLNGYMSSPASTVGTAAGSAPPPDKSTTGTWGVGHYGFDEQLRSAKFANSAARFLFTDRERLADGAVVYCLACQLWRGFIGTLGSASPLLHTGSLPTISRLLEHSQTSWEFLAFGQTDLWQAPASTFKRLVPPSPGGAKPYAWVAVPYVDAVSDAEVALLSAYVRGGGHLVLIGQETGTLYHSLNPRHQPAFHNLTKAPGRGSVVQIPETAFLAYKQCGGFPARCLQARLSLWETYFKRKHEASARVLVHGAPPSVWLNTWQHGSTGAIAVHAVNYHTNGTLDCNMSGTGQPQSGPTECDCSCELQPHNNSVVNVAVPAPFSVSLRVYGSDWSTSDSAEAWLYSPGDNVPRRLAVERGSQPGFLTAAVPGMDVYSIVVFVSCQAEIRARTQASETRKWLERLLLANASVGVSLFGRELEHAARFSAMLQADQLLGHIHGDRAHAMGVSEYEAIATRLQNTTSVLQALVSGLGSSVTVAASAHRTSLVEMCADGSCIAAFNLGPLPTEPGAVAPAGFATVAANTSYSASTGFGFVDALLHPGSVDSVMPDPVHRSLLWGSDRTKFRIDIPRARLRDTSGDLLVTLVSGCHDFATEPMEFLQSHPAGNFVGFASTSLAVAWSTADGSSSAESPCLLGARGLSTGYFSVRTCRVSLPHGTSSPLSLELILAPGNGTTGTPAGGNPFAWLLNAVIVTQASSSGVIPPPLAEGLAQSDRVARLGQASWLWAGPFDASAGLGMETVYPPEHELLSEAGVSLNGTYSGKAGATIRWERYESPGTARAPHLPLGRLLAGSNSTTATNRGSVAFGLARIHNTGAPRNVSFFSSISGLGKVYIRHEQAASATLVYEDRAITGLEDAENAGVFELGRGWNSILVKSVHSFDAALNHQPTDPLHFPSFAESEAWAQKVGLVERRAEWGAFLAIDVEE
jgi:hypothetical protein